MKKPLLFLLIFITIIFLLFSVRFIIGGEEDSWICQNNQWVRHGSPSSPKPETDCGNNASKQTSTQITQPSSNTTCSKDSFSMNITEAKQIANQSECAKQGTLKENTHVCNSYTGTWWVDIAPNKDKKGCNPACVVNIETKQAEINWRCTGLIPQ